MSIETRSATLTAAHNYNLRNQGWPNTFLCATQSDGDRGAIQADPVAFTKEKMGWYPSNADIIYFAKLSASNQPEALNSYAPWELEKNVFGNTPAAKGHFILPFFDQNRQLASGINGTYTPSRDKREDRPVSVAFYAGRVFYLMATGEVLYSQVLTDISRADKCYQEADPTAEDINELIATDGGLIDITGISKGLKLIPVGTELIIIANNGIWSISGSGDEGFSAVSQEVRKITSIGCVSADAAIEAENTVFYWSRGGIYVLTQDQVTGYLTAQSITDNTILSFYLDIRPVARDNARAFYDEESKKIVWFYTDDEDFDGVEWRYKYNKALIFDLTLKAFYTYSISTASTYPFISAMIQKKAGSFEVYEEAVTDGGVDVTDSSVTLTVQLTYPVRAETKIKLLTFVQQEDTNYKYTFSEFNDDRMLDWLSHTTDGVDYDSYVETGHDLAGDMIAEKETNTIYTFFKRTETEILQNDEEALVFDYPSSCYLRAKWDWSDTVDSGRWSDLQQIYRLNRHWIPAGTGPFDYGTEVVQTINQVRGKGRAVSLRFQSESGKDFHLLGWAIPYTAMTAA